MTMLTYFMRLVVADPRRGIGASHRGMSTIIFLVDIGAGNLQLPRRKSWTCVKEHIEVFEDLRKSMESCRSTDHYTSQQVNPSRKKIAKSPLISNVLDYVEDHCDIEALGPYIYAPIQRRHPIILHYLEAKHMSRSNEFLEITGQGLDSG